MPTTAPSLRLTLLALFGLAALAAPALAQTDPAPHPVPAAAAPAPDPNEPPKRRLDRLEKEVNEVRSIVLQARATGHPIEIKDAGPDPEVAALQARVDDLEAALTAKTGQIELLTHDLAETKQAAATAQSAAATLADRLDKLDKQVAALSAPSPSPPPPAAADPTAAASPGPVSGPAAAGDAKAAYAQARQLMMSGDYPAASSAFQAYLDRFGDQPAAPTARYWLGKIKYVQEDYPGAAASLIASLRGWPQTAWAPDAVLYLSQTLVRLNKPDDACATLKEFQRRYAKAPAATKALAAKVRDQAQCSR